MLCVIAKDKPTVYCYTQLFHGSLFKTKRGIGHCPRVCLCLLMATYYEINSSCKLCNGNHDILWINKITILSMRVSLVGFRFYFLLKFSHKSYFLLISLGDHSTSYLIFAQYYLLLKWQILLLAYFGA